MLVYDIVSISSFMFIIRWKVKNIGSMGGCWLNWLSFCILLLSECVRYSDVSFGIVIL